MSEMTQCNYCTLQDIKRRAKERGATVECRVLTPSEMVETFGKDWLNTNLNEGRPWWIVKESDKEEASAYFVELGARCGC